MSKALVIKGAGFATNKVETITLTQPVPCTAVSVYPSSKAFTAMNDTQQLTITKTPSGTTDTVTYSSSNTNVATVSSSGLITCVGVGSATITVTCGEQSATCAVTSTLTVVADDAYYVENGAKYSGSMNLSADPPKNHIGRTTDTRCRLYYMTTEYGNYRAFTSTTNNGKYLIPIPNGTTKISVDAPEGLRNWTQLVIANANEKQTYVSGADGNAALGIKPFGYSGSSYPCEFDISEYPTANGFIFNVQAASGVDASTITGKTTIVFA